MSKKLLYTISTINPETGKGDDIIATARAAVSHLQTLCEQDETGRYVGRFPIHKALEDAGFTTSVPHFILFLNFMGLVRKLSKDGSTRGEARYRYLVLDPTFFDLLVTEESVCAVLKQLQERLELQRSNAVLQKKIEKLEAAPSISEEDFAKMNENLAEVIAEVERLHGENAEKDARISELEAEVQASPKIDPKLVSEELMAKFKQFKSA